MRLSFKKILALSLTIVLLLISVVVFYRWKHQEPDKVWVKSSLKYITCADGKQCVPTDDTTLETEERILGQEETEQASHRTHA